MKSAGPWSSRWGHVLRRVPSGLMLGLLAACGGDGGEPGAAGAAGANQVVIAEGADMDKPNPLVYATNVDGQIIELIYMRLLGTRWVDGEIVYQTADENPMALARSYEFFGPDSASLRFRLRSDVEWTDGRPVTAHDVKFTYDTRGIDEVASPTQDFNREFREVVVEDDSTVVVHLNRRYSEVFYHTAVEIIPRHVYEGSDLSQMRSHPSLTDPAANLVTNGPMRITEWVRGQSIVLEPNPSFEPTPTIERIIFRIIPEETTRMIELQTGRVDIAQVPFHFVEQIRATDDVRLETMEKRAYEYVAYNPNAHSFFADPEIRRALGMAVDKEALIAGLQLDEFALPAGGPYAPIFRRLYDPEAQAPLPYDTAAARRVLEEKGWSRGADGVLARGGERFSFSLVTNGDNRRRLDIAQILEQQWGRLGIDANIQSLEFNTLVERMTAREFDARIGGWQVGLSADLFQIWGDPEGASNYVGYDNPEVQRLFAEAMAEPSPEAAAPVWRQAANLIVADQPYTWLFYYDVLYGVNNRVQGIEVNTLRPYGQVWEWRVE